MTYTALIALESAAHAPLPLNMCEQNHHDIACNAHMISAPMPQDDNVKRKAAKQAAEQQVKRQKDSKGKPRPAGRDKQWWEPEGGPAEPDDDRAFYLQEVRALFRALSLRLQGQPGPLRVSMIPEPGGLCGLEERAL